ncbi:hypothetical protein D3C72_2391840 [compost metagenome]
MPSAEMLIPRLFRSKIVIPSSLSSSLMALERLGCDTNSRLAASFIEPLFAISIA